MGSGVIEGTTNSWCAEGRETNKERVREERVEEKKRKRRNKAGNVFLFQISRVEHMAAENDSDRDNGTVGQ